MLLLGFGLLVIGSYLSLLADSSLPWWVGVEVGTVGFFAVLVGQTTRTEALLKVFIIQTLAALLFLWLCVLCYVTDYEVTGPILALAAILKLGMIPFAH